MPDKLKPIKPARLVTELKRLADGKKTGKYDADEYEHRFARMVGELRDRKISGSREEIRAALDTLRKDDTLRPEEWFRLEKQLGLE